MFKKILKRLNLFKKNELSTQHEKDKDTNKNKIEEKKAKNKSNTTDDIYPLW